MKLNPPDGRLMAKSFAADGAVVVGVDRNAEGITRGT